MTLINLRQPKSLNYYASSGSKKIPAMESRGMVERMSIQKLPFKYLMAIVFWSVTISPLSPMIDVLKTTMISMRKRKSMMALSVPF